MTQSLIWRYLFATVISLCIPATMRADVKVQMETAESVGDFTFPTIATPAINDAGAQAKWTLANGRADANSGALKVLNDGELPESDDSPSENFFFAAGSGGGSLIVDLGSLQEVSQVVTYSRHAGTRAPQVFSLYGATGDEAGFSATSVEARDSQKGGWKLLAKVDTRPLASKGNQHAASISDSRSSLGKFRFMRFDVSATETKDPFGNTFFSEMDILTLGGPEVKRVEVAKRQLLSFVSSDEQYKFTIDTTVAPDLHDWSDKALKPTILSWYPKIVDMLPSEDFKAPQTVIFQFLPADKMRGIPAWAQNGTISMNAGWFRGELEREALGAVVHEMAHVVQDYQRQVRGRRSPPGWIVEGIPDYIRWFLYEPQSKGAVLSKTALARAKHDASYRTTANFIDWVIRTHDARGDLLRRLNAAARDGKYSSETWQELTGQTEAELEKAWKSQ